MSPTTPVGIVFFKQTPFYSITWKHPVVVASSAYDRVQWQPYPAGLAAGSGGHAQVGGHPIQPIFAVESLTNNDYNNISLLSTEVSPAFIHLWRSGGWKVVNARMEEPGGGRRRRILNKSFYLLTTNCCGKEKFRHQNCLNC